MRRLALLVVVLLAVAIPAIAHAPKYPDALTGDNPFAVSGNSLTDDSLDAIAIHQSDIGTRIGTRAGGYTTLHFSSGAGGENPNVGAAANPGTFEAPMDASMLDNFCGKPGYECVLDGEPFVFAATITFALALANCPVDTLCSIVRSLGETPWTITTAGTAATAGPIFNAIDQTGGGWGAVINGHCISNQADTDAAAEDDNMDCYPQDGTAGDVSHMLWWHLTALVTGDGNDNGFTAHRSNTFMIVNGGCTVGVGATGNNPCFAPVHNSTGLVLTLTLVSQTGAAGHDTAFLGSSGSGPLMTLMWIDGMVDRGTGAVSGDASIEVNPDAGLNLDITLARVGVTASTGNEGIRIVTSDATSVTDLELHDVTVTGNADGISLPAATIEPTTVTNLILDGVVVDGVTDDAINLGDADWAATTSLVATQLLTDADDSAAIFTIAGGTPATADVAADFQTALNSIATRTVSVTSGAIDSNDAQLQWSDGSFVDPQLRCKAINDCHTSPRTSAYTLVFPFVPPVWVFNRPVTQYTRPVGVDLGR